MQKLKVTWQAGAWSTDDVQPTESALIPDRSTVRAIGETLIFEFGPMRNVQLVVPETRLVSAVLVDADADK